jgi:putative DNA primase/helicase
MGGTIMQPNESDFPPNNMIINAVNGTPLAKVIIRPSAPLTIARPFIDRYFTEADGTCALHHHRSTFYRWSGTAYPEAEEPNLRAKLYRFIADECLVKAGKDGETKPADPNIGLVNNAIDALRAETHLDREVAAPAWLDQVPDIDPKDVIACTNGLLHLPTMTLLRHTPAFFNHNSLDFAYDPNAPVPLEWNRFLGQLWPGDFEAIDTLHEIFGYCLTADTSHPKIFNIIGPRRSGKGTIAKILGRLVGRQNVSSPTLASLSEQFGLAPLIGKLVAIIGDARLCGKVDHYVIVERLLSISGEDELNVNRKGIDHWIGQLLTRVVITSNEILKLPDASGAFSGRIVLLTLQNSFYGKEDRGLLGKLVPELSGILNLAIKGWYRLRSRGYFVTPASSASQMEQIEDLSSPIGQFVRERCEIGECWSVSVDALFDAWCAHCATQGRDHPGTKAVFGKDLTAAYPQIRKRRVGGDTAGREHVYYGIKIRPNTPLADIIRLVPMLDFNLAGPQWSAS